MEIPLNQANKSYMNSAQIGSSIATYSVGHVIMTILRPVEITRRKIWSHHRAGAVMPPSVVALQIRLPSPVPPLPS